MATLAKVPTALPPQGSQGFVVTPPVAEGGPFTVVVPSFSAEHIFEIRRWMPRGDLLPVVGDEVLVVEDDQAEPWVVAWWPL